MIRPLAAVAAWIGAHRSRARRPNHRCGLCSKMKPGPIHDPCPLWISQAFLNRASVVDGRIRVGDCAFSALLIDVEWLDGDVLSEVVRLAETNAQVILPRGPRAPGKHPRDDYQALLDRLQARQNVFRGFGDAGISPLVAGDDVPPFWARALPLALYLFFGHPMVAARSATPCGTASRVAASA